MYHPPLNLARVMQSGVSGMLLTYLHGWRHGANTYVLGLPMTVRWLSSSSSIRQSWWSFSQSILQHTAWSTIVCSARELHVIPPYAIKEEIYVWAITQCHNTSTSQIQPSTSTFCNISSSWATICRVKQSDSTACHIHCRNLQAKQCRMLHKGGKMHPLIPLRHSPFERELFNHPDKAWTHWLLNSIKNGVALGYNGQRGPSKAHNLKLVLEHTQVID